MVTLNDGRVVHMIGRLTGIRTLVYAELGRLSMYRLVLLALDALIVIAFVLALLGLVVPTGAELLVSAVALAGACLLTDLIGHRLIGHRLIGRQLRFESSLITASILLFVLRPTIEPIGLAGLVIAAAVACASKYLLVWRGRHIFNPAAVGATVVTIVATVLPLDAGIGSSAWWVGSPILLVPVLVLGIIVAWRTEKLAVVSLFLLVALVVTTIRVGVQYQQAGLELSLGDAAWQMLSASPFVFLATFMLTEPLTTAPRRWQQLVVAGVVGLAAGWPIPVGYLTLGQERALLIGNLVAFILCVRGSLRLSLTDRGWLTPTIQELVFTVDDRLRFEAGQYSASSRHLRTCRHCGSPTATARNHEAASRPRWPMWNAAGCCTPPACGVTSCCPQMRAARSCCWPVVSGSRPSFRSCGTWQLPDRPVTSSWSMWSRTPRSPSVTRSRRPALRPSSSPSRLRTSCPQAGHSPHRPASTANRCWRRCPT